MRSNLLHSETMEEGAIREMLEPIIRERTIRQVAIAADLPRPNLSDWLNGKRRLYVDQLERLCGVLGYELRVVQARPGRPSSELQTIPPKGPKSPPRRRRKADG